jgi:hypothetical protein
MEGLNGGSELRDFKRARFVQIEAREDIADLEKKVNDDRG